MVASANSSDSKLLLLYFLCLWELPYWMLSTVKLETKLRKSSMSRQICIRNNRPKHPYSIESILMKHCDEILQSQLCLETHRIENLK